MKFATQYQRVLEVNLWDALDEYFSLLESSELAEKSKEDYYYFAERFVRWIDGGTIPGSQIH